MLKLKRKICKCGKPALPNRRVCYSCEMAKIRERRLASLAKKKERKEKQKMVRNGKRELTTKYLDALWSKETKKYYGNRCEHCGSLENLNSHHIIGRTNRAVRWDYRNCCVLCCICHRFNRHWSAHETPTIFTEWIIGKRGENWHKDLVVEARNLNVDRKRFLDELRTLNGE